MQPRLLAPFHPQFRRNALAEYIGIVHLLRMQGYNREFPRRDGLGNIGEMVVAGREIIGVETDRMVEYLPVVKAPAGISKGLPVAVFKPPG